MKRMTIVLSIWVMFLAPSVRAQAPQGLPKPGPEVRKLAFKIGTWNLEHDIKPFGAMRGGKFKAIETCDWYSGGFFVRCQWDSTGPRGRSKGVSFMGYDRNENVYTFRGFESTGDVIDAKGKVDGDTWNWTSDSKIGDVRTAGRVTIKQVSTTGYTYKLEMSQNGREFSVIQESTAHKVPVVSPARKP